MGILHFEIDDEANFREIIAAICATEGYRSQIVDPKDNRAMIPNPQTPGQFARAHIVSYLRAKVRLHREMKAIEAAKVEVQSRPDVPIT